MTDQQKQCYFERIARLFTRLSHWPDEDVAYDWVGFPPALSCSGCHPFEGGSCAECRWNRCQRCGTKHCLDCACCGLQNCVKPWASRLKVVGWAGICYSCKMHSSFTPARVPDECRSAFEDFKRANAPQQPAIVPPVIAAAAPVAAPPVAAAAAVAPLPVVAAAAPPPVVVAASAAAPPPVVVAASAAAALPVVVAASAAAPPPITAAADARIKEQAEKARVLTCFMVMAEVVYEISPDAIRRMGFPSIDGLLRCNCVHVFRTCSKCRWNMCGLCGSPDGLMCIACCKAPCDCNEHLYAWAGICDRCKGGNQAPQHPFHQVLGDALEAQYKLPQQALPVAASSSLLAAAPLATPSVDDIASILSVYLPEWKRPGPGEDPMKQRLFDVTEPNLLDEIQAIVTDSVQKSWLHADSLSGYPSHVLDKVKKADEYYIVQRVEANQNAPFRLLYQSQLTRMRCINAERDPGAQVRSIQKCLFHGTSAMNKNSIAKDGLNPARWKNGACGKGAVYASEFVRLSAEGHADPGAQCMVIMVDAIVGRNCKTRSTDTEPPADHDSGGDGTGWKYAIFDNSRVYPRFFLTLQRVTRDEYEMHNRMRAKRARGV